MADDFYPGDLDARTRDAISDRINSALSLGDSYDDAVSSGKLPEVRQIEPKYGSEGISSAIQNKFNKINEDRVSEIKRMNELQYPHTRMQKLTGAVDLANKQFKFDYQRQMAIRQRMMAEEAQRAQILGQLIGIGGAIAGGMIAGPAGAMVGGAAASMSNPTTASNTPDFSGKGGYQSSYLGRIGG